MLSTVAMVAVSLALFIPNIDGSGRVLVSDNVAHTITDENAIRALGSSSDSGTFSSSCCVYGNCSCPSLYNLLVNLSSNVTINVTSDITLFSVVLLNNKSNIAIRGYNNPTVYCSNYGGLHLMSCYNCTIEGITWKGCGGRDSSDSSNIHPVLKLSNSSSILIKNCSFENSVGQALVVSGASQDVNINNCSFLHNKQYEGHGAAIHYSSNTLHRSTLNLTITNCKFSHNSGAMSVVYFGPSHLHFFNIHLQDSSFYFNEGVPIYLSNQYLEIYGKNDFHGNIAENGGAIFIGNYSKVVFYANAIVNFTNNTATSNGGALFLTNNSSILLKEQPTLSSEINPFGNKTFQQVFMFHQNKAKKYGKDIYTAYHSHIIFGINATVTFSGDGKHKGSNALHIKYHSTVTYEDNTEVVFRNNYGGAAYISDQSKVSFKGNATVRFLNNIDTHDQKSAAMHVSYSSVTFKGDCKVIFNNINEGALNVYHSLVTFEERCAITFNNNRAINGGVMIIEDHSNVTFEGTSIVKFHNSQAQIAGGAIYIASHSTVAFKGNSRVKFIRNNAMHGGTIYTEYSTVIFEANSTVTFNSNEAYLNGGAVYATKPSNITFKGNSVVMFNDNIATHGGAMYIIVYPTVRFKGNSVIKFINNKASIEGGALYTNYSNVIFEESSMVTFGNNGAQFRGGALCNIDHSNITFKGYSTVTFDTNTAYTDGGAAYINLAVTTFAENTNVTFYNNSANTGGAVYSFRTCVIAVRIVKFTGSSTVAFINNKGNIKGGAVCMDGAYPSYTYIKDCYALDFDSFSRVTFTNNEAVNGGAMYVGYNINIRSRENSTITFQNNNAHIGGAIYSYTSNITIQENSSAMFNNNVALQDGGVMFSYTSTNISFTENSTATFTHNKAVQGGVIYIRFNSIVEFQGNCTVSFTENKAIEYGGVIYSSVNSLIIFDGYANILFHSNMAKSGGAINIYNAFITSTVKSHVTFESNNAEMGGAIYITLSNITFTGNSSIQFINNTALQDGGAVYLSDHFNFILTNNTKVNFSNNFANDDGETIYVQIKESLIDLNISEIYFRNISYRKPVYINVPNSCNKSCLFQSVTKIQKNISLPFATSPRTLVLHDPAQCINGTSSDCYVYYISNIMLGQEIRFNACVLDYYDQPTELNQFLVTGMYHQHYNLSGSKYISVLCNHVTQAISILGDFNTLFNYSIDISLYSAKTSGSKIISVNLLVELSQCHPGFYYSSKSKKCECYNTKEIISCSGSSSTIKRGYWFGSVNGKSTVASCPNDYCNFTCCEITNGIYHLSPVRANQCRAHRSGTACSNCEKAYTLSFDSPECIEINNCTVGQTLLVILLSLLYWIAVIVTVFVMMYFKVAIGSLYAITYYYSVVDILLRQASFISSGLYTTINIMSSLAKLTPQFLGRLCLVKNMSGIDQQLIHYVHPIVVSLILVIISVLARRSRRISSFISRGIIHFICFLLLLSYTSVVTTSLLLMRSLTFEGIHKVYTYLSPDIEYFHGRHLAYIIMAIIFTITIVIGLPLLLLLEPFLNSKINFVKIKPLLDQFQGVYKGNYRCFAAYYMICRIVIIILVIIKSSVNLTTQYVLISSCAIMALIHLVVRPYVDNIYNIFDGIILQLIVIISVLPLIEFAGNYNETVVTIVVYLFVTLPLASFIAIKLWLNKNGMQNILKSLIEKCSRKYTAIPTDDVEIPPINEIGLTIDNSMRRNATVVSV